MAFGCPAMSPELEELLRKARDHVMTPAEAHAQRRSFVIGQMGCSHPEMSRQAIEALVDRALGPGPAPMPAATLAELRDRHAATVAAESEADLEARRMARTLKRITRRQIFAAARRMAARQHKRLPNWSFAMSLFGLGSTYAWAACREMGIDPDSLEATPWPDQEPPRLATEAL